MRKIFQIIIILLIANQSNCQILNHLNTEKSLWAPSILGQSSYLIDNYVILSSFQYEITEESELLHLIREKRQSPTLSTEESHYFDQILILESAYSKIQKPQIEDLNNFKLSRPQTYSKSTNQVGKPITIS